MMEKIKLGLIGCGLCARELHLPALKQLEDRYEIIAVCARDEDKVAAFAKLSGAIKQYTNYEELLRDPEIEAVFVTYPFEMNYEITKAALENRKHILVEKPMAKDLEEAEKMMKLEKNTQFVTMLAENYKYRNAVTATKKYLDQGIIGKPGFIQYQFRDFFAEDSQWVSETTWRLHCNGGVCFDRDIHFAATIRYLMGDAVFATGRSGSIRKTIGPIDYYNLNVVFANGAVGILNDCASVCGKMNHELMITGEKGTIWLTEGITKLQVVLTNGSVIEESYENDKNNSFVNEFCDFYQAVKEHSQVRSSFYEGYKDFQLGVVGLEMSTGWKKSIEIETANN